MEEPQKQEPDQPIQVGDQPSCDFEEFMRLVRYSPNTRAQYMLYYRIFTRYEAEGEAGIKKFLLLHNNGCARSFLRCYFALFKKKKSIEIPKARCRKGSRLPKFLYKEEIEKLLAQATPFASLVILLGFEAGLRVSEILNLRLLNIDFEKKTIRLKGKGDVEAIVKFSDRTRELLLQYIKEHEIGREDKLFSGMNRRKTHAVIQKLGKDVLNKSISVHFFRHSCGFAMRKNGVDLRTIQTYLRHKKITSTEIYTAVDAVDIRDAWQKTFG